MKKKAALAILTLIATGCVMGAAACGHTHTFAEAWSTDAEYHWHAATCGHAEAETKEAHAFGEWIVQTPATETQEGTKSRSCGTCGYVDLQTIPKAEHEHTFSEKWTYDENQHWHEAACGHDVEDGRGDHTLEGGECSVCGYVDAAALYTFTEVTADDGTVGYEIAVKEAALSKETLSIPETYNGKPVVAIGEQGFAKTAIKTVALPASVQSLGVYAFWKSAIEEIALPDTVTSLQKGVFYECEKLNKVVLGSGVETLPTYLFSNTPSLKSVTVPDGVKTIEKYAFYLSSVASVTLSDSVTTLQDGAFQQSGDLETVVLGKGITQIPAQGFYKCAKLKPFSFANITSVGNFAFKDCTAFEAEIPATVSIGEKAFQSSGVKSVVWNKSSTSTDEFMDCTKLVSIEFTDNVKSIGGSAFKNCSALKTIKIGKALSSIYYNAFAGCTARETITVSAENTVYSAVDNMLLSKNGKQLFLASAAARDVPSSVTQVESYAFNGNKVITTLVCSANLQFIQEYAFYGCENLVSVTLMPNATAGAMAVKREAFANCSALETVVVPENVTSLGVGVFKGCTALKSVRFEHATGWKVNKGGGSSSSSSIEVTNDAQNAENFVGAYADYSWHR